MLSHFWKLFFGVVILTAVSRPVAAEQPVRPETPVANPRASPNLPHPPSLARSAGYIFAGTVQSVERVAPKGNGVAVVQINFHVDEAMHGVRPGETLAIREWAGLWEYGERYRAGERVLLFLYPPSKLGLTSPVRGPLGRFRIGLDGRVVLDRGRIDFLRPHPSTGRRLQERTGVSPRELVSFLRRSEEQ